MECAAVQSKILERIGSLFPPASAESQSTDSAQASTDNESSPTVIPSSNTLRTTNDQVLMKERKEKFRAYARPGCNTSGRCFGWQR